MILYIPFLAHCFAVTPLSWTEWGMVMWLSLPVIVLDELLKYLSRMRQRRGGFRLPLKLSRRPDLQKSYDRTT